VKAKSIEIKAYNDAKFNMAVADLRVAIDTEDRRLNASKDEVTYHTAILEGYKKALLEKS